MLFAALGLGVAAINTGNNLLYLLCSMLLALVVVSGILSEQTMRGLKVEAIVPDELYAGRPVVVGVSVTNQKRWLTSHSVIVEVAGTDPPTSFYLPSLAAEARQIVAWPQTMPTRGLHRLPGVRVGTRFPFGLFAKVSRLLVDHQVVVFPAVQLLSRETLDALGAAEGAGRRRRGRGHDLHSLRDYRDGDDRRLIHWRSTARTQVLTVRELEAETAMDTRLRLIGTGAANRERLERGLSEAASLAVHLLRAGAAVELQGPRMVVARSRGREQEARILRALALYEPEKSQRVADRLPGATSTGSDLRRLREVVVDLG
jgi:uncharacterized protein (DUF58 family)